MSQFSALKVLLVDDSASMRKIERKLLGDLGITDVVEADDGKNGLEKLRAGAFDLVLLDWSMPVMNGIEMLKEVRGDEKLMHLPVIMVTAEAQHHNIMRAGEAGANAYLPKPFTAEKLGMHLTRLKVRAAGSASHPAG